jgi:hypothetical protein
MMLQLILTMSHKTVKYGTSEEVVSLVKAFESCSLPRSEWTHQAHLIVALWYLSHYSQLEATNCIRNCIQNYNNAIGIKTTKDSGYHETLTIFWIKIVSQYLINKSKISSFVDLVNGLIQDCNSPDLPLEYYSKNRLMSWEARQSWIEPDLKSLE